MKDYSELEYMNLFNKFFNAGELQGPHKCVFLHSLVDIGLIDNNNLIGKEWISQDNLIVTLDLNFMAIRFAKTYHDILDLDIKYSPAFKNRPTILSTFEEQYSGSNFPTLRYFASQSMKLFRNKIIRHGITSEVLPNLVEQTNKIKPPDFPEMYDWKRGTNTIVFQKSLLDFMKLNRHYLRYQIGKKLKKYLEELNPDKVASGVFVDMDNPFYQYVMGHQRLFLADVVRDTEMKRFEASMETYVKLKHVSGVDVPVQVWGLRSTQDNKNVWQTIRRGDVLLFSNNNQCFAKGVVLQTVQNTDEAERLWDKDDESVQDLLIVFQNVTAIRLNLESSRVRLIEPTMPDEHIFPIIRVDERLVSGLVSAYYDIEEAISNLSEPTALDVNDVSISLIERKTKVRKGQDAFRTEVLKNYNKTCAVCNVNMEDLLEASHILPVKSNHEAAGHVKNGICFCALHHKMFDLQYMYFDTGYTLRFTNKTSQYLQDTCIKKQIVESECHEMPSSEYLEKSSRIAKCREP